MTTRRLFVAGAALSLIATCAIGQSTKPVPKVGVLRWERNSLDAIRKSLPQALRERGYTEGGNIAFLWRSADEKSERADEIMREFLRERVDLIVAGPTPAAHAARRATTTIPIVLTGVADPVATGLVTSLARPGGNVTGVSLNLFGLAAKRVEILRDALPAIKHIAFLGLAPDPSAKLFVADIGNAAKRLGMTLHVELIPAVAELDNAFARIAASGAQAVIIQTLFVTYRDKIARLALQHRLPAISDFDEFVRAGGLLSYGADRSASMSIVTEYIDRILKGAKPGDLPIQEPMRFTLAVNLKTAKSLGVTVAPFVLDRADEVIR